MLKINIGFSRKIGDANYGSRGANVGLEVDAESGLLSEPERLRDRVRQLFVLAKASVDEELSERTDSVPSPNGAPTTAMSANGTRKRDNTRRATASQVRAIHAISDRNGVELADLLHGRYGIDKASELSITEASQLIDELKGAGNGTASSQNGGRR